MSVPYWRYMRATDEGCAIYQCLSCYETWEGRSEPGWWDGYVNTIDLVDGGWMVTANGVPTYTAKRANPIYRPVWKYCPHCGCEWKCSIRCGFDNTRMLGGRRALAYNFRRPFEYNRKPTDKNWWVIQGRVTEKDYWCDLYKISLKRSAHYVFHELCDSRNDRERLGAWYIKYFRATIKSLNASNWQLKER